MNRIKKILIVGGGTSGWLSAAYLAKRLGCGKPDSLQITLIESSDIGTIGVGEATIPPIRSIISALGISEAHFMRETSATFKLAIRFDDWLHLPDGGSDGVSGNRSQRHSYLHSFGPYTQIGGDLMAAYWAQDRVSSGKSFVEYTMMEGRICEAGRGPKTIGADQYSGLLEYAYHFDAGLVAKLLKDVAGENGVKHLIGTVTGIKQRDDGAIKSLATNEHGELTADLFIDCTGFAARLIEKEMGVEFHDLTDTLFCDRAIACQIPYADPKRPIPSYTVSTAQENGWTWDIPLNNRRGVGYVYSSKYTNDDRAEEVLVNYIGAEAKDVKLVRLKIRVGSRHQQWVKNCVSIGLSGGFVEPLESTGIYLCDIALRWLADFFPNVEQMPLAAVQFNARMNETYADIVDFIKMHYCLSQRSDTDFWIDNRREETIPTTLKDKLEAWKYRLPGQHEFSNLPKVFGLTNYMQVMYGMNFVPDLSGQQGRYLAIDEARRLSEQFRNAAEGGLQVLPVHRDLIENIYRSDNS